MITIFLCFNLLWFVTGVTSCGCFGTIQVTAPLVMLVFDSCWLVLMLFAITKSPIPLDHWVFSHQRRLVLGVLVSLTPLGALLHNDGFTHVWAGSQTRVENAILPLDADLGIVESTRLKLIVLSTSSSECRRLASDSKTISQFDGVVYSINEWVDQSEHVISVSMCAHTVWPINQTSFVLLNFLYVLTWKEGRLSPQVRLSNYLVSEYFDMRNTSRIRFGVFGLGWLCLVIAVMLSVFTPRTVADVPVPGLCVGAVPCATCVPYTLCMPFERPYFGGWYCYCYGGNDGWQPGLWGLCDWDTSWNLFALESMWC